MSPLFRDFLTIFYLRIICGSAGSITGCRKPEAIVFLLDESTSVVDEDTYEMEKSFVKNVVSALGGPQPQVAIIRYSDQAFIAHGFSDSQNKDDILSALASLQFPGKQKSRLTDISQALQTGSQILSTSNIGAVVLLSDGYETAGQDPVLSAETLLSSGHIVYSIGLSPFDHSALMAITGDSSKVFSLNNGPAGFIQHLYCTSPDNISEIIPPSEPVRLTCSNIPDVFNSDYDMFAQSAGPTSQQRLLYPDQPNPIVDNEPECGTTFALSLAETIDITTDLSTVTVKTTSDPPNPGVGLPASTLSLKNFPSKITNFVLLNSTYLFQNEGDKLTHRFTESSISVSLPPRVRNVPSEPGFTATFHISYE